MPGHGETDLVDGEPLDLATFASLTAGLLDTLRSSVSNTAHLEPGNSEGPPMVRLMCGSPADCTGT
jgi:hypothetical protein